MLENIDKHLPNLTILSSQGAEVEQSVGGLPDIYQLFSDEQSKKVVSLPSCFTKLLIITQFYPPDYAATGQLISELATQLGQLGMGVSIFTGQPGYAFDRDWAPKRETDQQVSVRRSRVSRLWPLRIRGRAINGLLFCLRTAIHLCKSARNHHLVMVTSEPPYLPFMGYLASLIFRLPYICLLYDLYPDVVVDLGVMSSNHWLVKLWSWLNRQIWEKAEGLIVLSPSMKARVVSKYPSSERKISVISNWANPNYIRPLEKQHNWFAHQYQLTENFVVQYSGNLGRCHDLETILKAAEILRNDPIKFVFIGQGAKLEACQLWVKEVGLKNCLFLPYQDKSVLPYSLTACDLALVSISPGLEGVVVPSKLYGILAASRPVAAICEPQSYLRELIGQAQCGQAFNNGDGQGLADYILQLASNPELVKDLGRSGRSYLQAHFTPEIIAVEYLKVLTQAAKKRRR